MSRNINKAVYAGSFDPFTNGHLVMVKKVSKLFDWVYVVMANNSKKHRTYDIDKMKEVIQEILKDNALYNVAVVTYDGLVADFCREHDVQYLIRGLRNNMDYNYEENISDINKLINPNVESVYFRAENDLERTISSSMVKELFSYGKDVSLYVPTKVLELMQSSTQNS